MHVRLPAGRGVLAIEVRDPAGKVVPAYSGTVGEGGQPWPVPFAVNDATGDWRVTVRDPLGGGVATAEIRMVAAQ